MDKWRKIVSALFVIFVVVLVPAGVVSAKTGVSDTKEDASIMEADKRYSSKIDSSDDVDYYRIDAVDYVNSYYFSFFTDANATGYLLYNLYTSDGKSCFTIPEVAWPGGSAGICARLKPGETYYLKVEGSSSTGYYQVNYSIKNDIPDTKEEALYIDYNIRCSDSIDNHGDQDWYKIYSEKRQILTLYALYNTYEEDNAFAIQVFDELGKEILSWSTASEYKISTIIEKGNYYIKVSDMMASDSELSVYLLQVTSSDLSAYLKQASDGNWYYYEESEVDTSKTGLVYDENCGWWYVENGKVDFGFNDLYYDEQYGWWKITNGAVDFGYNGLYNSPTYGWWKVSGGTVDFGYNDLYYDTNCGWWKVNNGYVDFGYNDLYNSPTCGWWKVNNGYVDFGYNDLYNSPTCGWWKVNNGYVDFGYSDLYNSPTYGWWKVNSGYVDFGYNDWYYSPTCGYWYINGGAVVF